MAERAQRSADSLASNSVLLHDLALLGSERSRSKKNAFWDGQLANVVNEAAATDSHAKILRQAQLIRHGNGVFGESFAVPLGIRILGLDAQRQTEEHSFGVVQLVGELFQSQQRIHSSKQFVPVHRLA